MRLDPSNISPFQDTFVREDDSWTKLYKLRSLPVLQDPIATIVHDDSATKHSYMLILGDPVGEGWESCNHPILVCINLVFNTWRIISLRNSRKVPCGRAHGSMIVSGELRTRDRDVYLCVFGGVTEEIEDVSGTIYPLHFHSLTFV